MSKLFAFSLVFFLLYICECSYGVEVLSAITGTTGKEQKAYETILSVVASGLFKNILFTNLNHEMVTDLVFSAKNALEENMNSSPIQAVIIIVYSYIAGRIQTRHDTCKDRDCIASCSVKRWDDFESETEVVPSTSEEGFLKRIGSAIMNLGWSFVLLVVLFLAKWLHGLMTRQSYKPVFDNIMYFSSTTISVFVFRLVFGDKIKFLTIPVALILSYSARRMVKSDFLSNFFENKHFHLNAFWFIFVLSLASDNSYKSLILLLFTLAIVSPLDPTIFTQFESMGTTLAPATWNIQHILLETSSPMLQELVGYYLGRWSYFLSLSVRDPVTHAFIGSLSDPILPLLFQGTLWMKNSYNHKTESKINDEARKRLLNVWLPYEWIPTVIRIIVPTYHITTFQRYIESYKEYIFRIAANLSVWFQYTSFGLLVIGCTFWRIFLYESSSTLVFIVAILFAVISYILMYPLALMFSNYAPSKEHIENLVGTPEAILNYFLSSALALIIVTVGNIIVPEIKSIEKITERFARVGFTSWLTFHILKRVIYTASFASDDFSIQLYHGFGLDIKYILAFETARAIPAVIRFYTGISNLYDDDYMLFPMYDLASSAFSSTMNYGIIDPYVKAEKTE